MRKKIVAGNWKMNKSLTDGQALATEVKNIANDELTGEVQLILCTPFLHLTSVSQLLKGQNRVSIGAQNCHQLESGAYTGEISAPMLASAGIPYVILGHSERREYFGETDALLASKVKVALKNNLIPIFCVGEVLAEREKGIHIDVVKRQMTEGLFHLSADDFSKVVVAYEPVWAIGTGVTASTEQAQEMHAQIRKMIVDAYGKETASKTSILYGGSCKPSNAKELFACEDVDGGLIGGASLVARDFIDIAKSF